MLELKSTSIVWEICALDLKQRTPMACAAREVVGVLRYILFMRLRLTQPKFLSKNFFSVKPIFQIFRYPKVEFNFNAESAVHRGQEFENFVLAVLQSLNFQVTLTGKRGDYGIDFRGSWRLPDKKQVAVVGMH